MSCSVCVESDKLLVADNGNHRIQVFSVDVEDPTCRPEYLYSFGEPVFEFTLKGRSIYFTGKIRITKAIAEQQAAALGAIIHKAASKTTNFMVAGSGAPSAQLAAARKRGIVIWSEEQFNNVVSDDEDTLKEEAKRREGQAGRGSSRQGQLCFPGNEHWPFCTCPQQNTV